jgi:diaminopimelate decarboxylase
VTPWAEPPSVTATPFYFYSLDVLTARVKRAREALPVTLLYAVKANPHPAILRALQGQVDGLDVASEGELRLALDAGWSGQQLSFAGPGKSLASLELAVAAGATISVESLRELDVIASLGRPARVRLRLNPRARLNSWRVQMTGVPSPFGIDEEELELAAERLRAHAKVLAFDGIHVHPGGQCTSVGGYLAAIGMTLDLAERVHRLGLPLERINFGGGLGVISRDDELDVDAVGKRMRTMFEKFRATVCDFEAVLEPGRWLVGPAGLYVARVVSEKQSRGVHFTVLDGGMNHHLGATGHLAHADAPRPRIFNASRREGPLVRRTLTGPLCTPLDTFGEVELVEPRVGDLIAVEGAGAYGYSFSPLHFLGHPLPKEVFSESAPASPSRAHSGESDLSS